MDPAGLAIQLMVVIGTLAVAGSAVSYHGSPKWLAPAALIAASVLGGIVHAKWAATDAPLPATVRSTFHARTEGLTLALAALILEGVRALAPTLAPEFAHLAASARLAFLITAAVVIGHALIAASSRPAIRERAGDPETRIQIPRRIPRLRAGHAARRQPHVQRRVAGCPRVTRCSGARLGRAARQRFNATDYLRSRGVS